MQIIENQAFNIHSCENETSENQIKLNYLNQYEE